MEEPQSGFPRSDDRSLTTAESLRALQEQADQTLAAHRNRVGEIEIRINEKLQRIADELSHESLADEQTAAAMGEQAALLEQLQQTLAEKECEVEEVLEQLAAQALEFEAQLAARDDELEQVLQLGVEETQQRESLEQELASTRNALEEIRAKGCDACAQKSSEITQIGEQLNELEQQHGALKTQHEAQQSELDDSQQAVQAAQQQQVHTAASLAEAEQRIAELTKLVQDGEENTQQQQAHTAASLAEAEQRIAELTKLVQDGEENTQQQQAHAAASLAEAEQRSAELTKLVQDGEENTQQQQAHAAASLAEAEQRSAELTKLVQDGEENTQQLEQTRRKFELALADVHKLKRENAELHEELLSRPAADAQESPELVSLRAERDALAQRVAELENAPTPTSAADGQQEMADLQRRFELAVDDVRQLKQENAGLKQQQAAAPAVSATSASDEPQDWQAQRARLMATLDAEDQGTVDEPRRQERATIEGAISITDSVVAEKDAALTRLEAELEELRSQLEARPAGQDLEELRAQIAAELLGDEEAVQTEVGKLQQQQKQLEGKLREAELEISVQRATLAREQAALEEKLAQLPNEDEAPEGSSSEKPRRRWLSALGLNDEEQS